MEGDRALYLQPRVLRVEGVHILLGESRARVRPDGGRDAYALLRQDVERARVDVAVDEDDLALGALDQRDQQLEGGPGLPVEEDLLLRDFVGLHVVEDALESLVGGLLILQLAQLHRSDLLEHGGVAHDEVAHLDEAVHDADANRYGRFASEYRGEHAYALSVKTRCAFLLPSHPSPLEITDCDFKISIYLDLSN